MSSVWAVADPAIRQLRVRASHGEISVMIVGGSEEVLAAIYCGYRLSFLYYHPPFNTPLALYSNISEVVGVQVNQ